MLKPVKPNPVKGLYETYFWENVKKRNLCMQECSDCSTIRFPSGPCCPNCLSTEYSWSPISGKGKILTWVTFRRQYLPEFPIPHTVAAVELEEGPILIADIVDVEPGNIQINQPVEIIYEDVLFQEGEEMVIYHWKPSLS